MKKEAISYETVSVGGELIGVALGHREGRTPVKSAKITASGEVELTCKDGAIEVMGTPGAPCPEDVVKKLRNHHEGLLLIFFGKNGPLEEQMVKAPFWA